MAGPLDERVRERIVAETRGNPLALLELPRGLTPAELAGGFGLTGGPALSGRIEESFRQRWRRCRPRRGCCCWSRRPSRSAIRSCCGGRRLAGHRRTTPRPRPPTPGWSSSAAGALPPSAGAVRGVPRGCAEERRRRTRRSPRRPTPARIPIAAPGTARRRRRGSTRTSPRSWSARPARAGARGGLAAGAAFHQRAAELTPDPARRARRALVAAQASTGPGRPTRRCACWPWRRPDRWTSWSGRGRSCCEAQITFVATRGRDAPPLLLEAARRLEPLDATLARETYLDAFAAALSAGRLVAAAMREVADAVLAADWEPATDPCDCCWTGWRSSPPRATRRARRTLKRALQAFRDEALSEDEELRWLWLACHVARALGDDAGWDVLTARQVELARAPARWPCCPSPSTSASTPTSSAGGCGGDGAGRGGGRRRRGHGQPRRLARRSRWPTGAARTPRRRRSIEARRKGVLQRGEGLWLSATEWGSAVRYNGLGRYDEALRRGRAGRRGPARARRPVGAGRADRGGRPQRQAERAADRARAAGGDRRGQRHGLGAGGPGPRAGAAR